jgi:acetyltransferase-like isoleucine patch superfamily enzyme
MRQTRLWAEKWRWYERNSLPWNRAAIHWHFMRREAFLRWPVHGNVLQALREGRLTVGAGSLLEPGVWITAPGDAQVSIGKGVFLNLGVMIASQQLVEIGDHCMLANGCFVSDASHRYDDLEQPITWQGFQSKGPTKIGANCWLGAHVVVTSAPSAASPTCAATPPARPDRPCMRALGRDSDAHARPPRCARSTLHHNII